MNAQEKLELLSSLSLWEHVPKDRLVTLANYLRVETYKGEAVIFEEGAKADGLYFICSGHVHIRKKMIMPDGSSAHKELALLSPGHCIGEMTLFEEVPRSAQALASDDCVLLKLGRDELAQWLKANPSMAMDFFVGLVQVLSQRLRRSSNELISLFDISQWLAEPAATGREFLQKCLDHLMPHLEGTWSAGAYLYNEFNDELELAASAGNFTAAAARLTIPKITSTVNAWVDAHTFLIPLPGKERVMGHMVFYATAALSAEEKEESGMLLTTSSRLIAATLENIRHRNEEKMRARLSINREQYGSGF
jgi:CRP-like cAMP-binding protein